MEFADKKIDLTKHKCTDGAIVSILSDCIKMNYTKGEWPEVEFFWDGDLKDYNCATTSNRSATNG